MIMLSQKQHLTDIHLITLKNQVKRLTCVHYALLKKRSKYSLKDKNKDKNIQKAIDEIEKIFEKNDDDDIEEIIKEQNKNDEKSPVKRKITDWFDFVEKSDVGKTAKKQKKIAKKPVEPKKSNKKDKYNLSLEIQLDAIAQHKKQWFIKKLSLKKS